MSKKKGEAVAVVTFKNASKLSPETCREISNWLRRLGRHLQTNRREYDKKMTNRYILN